MKPDLRSLVKSLDRELLSSAILVLLVCAAAAGVLSGLSPAIMIAAAALALVFWELMEQMVTRRKNDNVRARKNPEWVHIRLLVISVGTGLLLAEAGLQVHISLPFGIVILTGMLIPYCFYRFYRLIIH